MRRGLRGSYNERELRGPHKETGRGGSQGAWTPQGDRRRWITRSKGEEDPTWIIQEKRVAWITQ